MSLYNILDSSLTERVPGNCHINEIELSVPLVLEKDIWMMGHNNYTSPCTWYNYVHHNMVDIYSTSVFTAWGWGPSLAGVVAVSAAAWNEPC